MKILIDHGFPFLLAHGGFQTQIEQTLRALRANGCDAERLEWWNDKQSVDLIHYFGNPSPGYLEAARTKGIKIVVSDLRSSLGVRPAWMRRSQQAIIRSAQQFLPEAIPRRLGWMSYRMADSIVAGTSWEAQLMRDVFGCPPDLLHVVPNGVEPEFFAPTDVERTSSLISTATIHPRKRVLELAQAAVLAQVRIRFIGKPYSQNDPYYRAFIKVIAANPEWLQYEGAITSRVELAAAYHASRGFVLVSTMEALSLAALEAAAAGCMLLLSDLPWARVTFGDAAQYCPNSGDPKVIAIALKKFVAVNPRDIKQYHPLSWSEVAGQLGAIYAKVCAAS